MQILSNNIKDISVTLTLTAEEVARLIAAAASDVIIAPQTITKLEDALEAQMKREMEKVIAANPQG